MLGVLVMETAKQEDDRVKGKDGVKDLLFNLDIATLTVG